MLKIFWVLSIVFCIQTKEIDDLKSSKFQKELLNATRSCQTKEVKHILDNYVIYNGAYDLEYYSACNAALFAASCNFEASCNATLFEDSQKYHTEIIKLLIAAGADVNAKCRTGSTALVYAARYGNKEIVKLLITAGADVNAKGSIVDDGRTALMVAAAKGNTEMAKLLIDAGADVNAKDNGDCTALNWAIDIGHTEIAKLLIAAGANVNAKNFIGWTMLMKATIYGHTKIVKLLLTAGADVNAKTNIGMTALNKAVIKKNPKITKMLIEHGADSGELFYSLLCKRNFKEAFFLDYCNNFYNLIYASIWFIMIRWLLGWLLSIFLFLVNLYDLD